MDSREAVVMHAEDADCSFCFPPESAEWFNEPVARSGDYALAIPSLGCLVPGYLLVVPVAHVTSTRNISDGVKPGFAAFAGQLVAYLEWRYGGPVTIFEHGGCSSPYTRRSACINHAHLHLVPGSYALSQSAPDHVTTRVSLEDFLKSQVADPYLMLQEPEHDIVSFADISEGPQFFRRVIAERLGMPGRWDYALYPFYDNIEQTYKDCSELATATFG